LRDALSPVIPRCDHSMMRTRPPAKLSGDPAPSQTIDPSTLVRAFWIATLLTLAAYVIPQGRYLIYPFALLATWAHEMGHGLAALVAGGRFDRLELFADLGGVAYHRVPAVWYAAPLTAAGGLLGPAFAGGVTIVAGSRLALARWVCASFAALLLLSLVLWVRNPFGIVVVAALGVVYLGIALYAPLKVRIFVVQLTGIQLCLSALAHLDYLFTPGFERGGEFFRSDTQAIADALFLPYWFWGGVIAGLSLLILVASFWLAWGGSIGRNSGAAYILK
jgi:hypothetical protein